MKNQFLNWAFLSIAFAALLASCKNVSQAKINVAIENLSSCQATCDEMAAENEKQYSECLDSALIIYIEYLQKNCSGLQGQALETCLTQALNLYKLKIAKCKEEWEAGKTEVETCRATCIDKFKEVMHPGN